MGGEDQPRMGFSQGEFRPMSPGPLLKGELMVTTYQLPSSIQHFSLIKDHRKMIMLNHPETSVFVVELETPCGR